MKSVQHILGVVHAALWMTMIIAMNAIFDSSPSRAAYGLLCAWWVTLYVASLLRTKWRALPAFLGLMLIALVIDATGGMGLLYHDPPARFDSSFLLAVAGQLLLWVSPIVINEIATSVRDRFAMA